MDKINEENEVIKKKYFDRLHHRLGRSVKTVDSARKAIARYEQNTGYESFKYFTKGKAIEFKGDLFKTRSRKGELLSASTILHTVKPLMEFLYWLADQPGYKRAIKPDDVGYLNLTDNDRRKIQTGRKLKEYPSVEQVNRVLAFNPKNDVEMRDRAILATLLCTGIRHDALISLKVKHFSMQRQAIIQDPREVHTKKAKWINSKLIDIEGGAKQIVIDWVLHLTEALAFSDNDPLFPKEKIVHNQYKQFEGSGTLSREHIHSQEPLRRILRGLFEQAGVKYYKPHSFRDTLTHHLLDKASLEEAVAVSLNLGHENLATTINNYYIPTPEQQFEIIDRMGNKKDMDLQTALQVIQNVASNK